MDAVTYVFDEDGFYVRLANRLLDQAPWYRPAFRHGHGLCLKLDGLAKGLDPATYAQLLQQPVSAGLLALGLPKFMATTLGAASAFGTKKLLAALPVGHLTKALRALIPLACPNLEVCPARADVLKTYASPALAVELKALTQR
ncbi:hypothetical protein [Amycolatopsis saalfeldensis]|uniref:Uncharacterized protein n=1 Tax=Amycolatopsis saalfeldensis TaxID=394193 RepID=A0A1H8YK75_9PSEU|nr:hypothetical protein [Amycolatopsis saalfeldensis]SEP52547.1 hypothetical protein SAMN04489732_12118 [Amycolatopsis saalfeldensis]